MVGQVFAVAAIFGQFDKLVSSMIDLGTDEAAKLPLKRGVKTKTKNKK